MSRSKTITLDHLRRYAVARTLFAPTTLGKAIARLGFVQADPIRAPARAQDLTLRHRVKDYRAGDLERRYPRLDVEEDCLVNYGFVPRSLLPLMHPRTARRAWDAATERHAKLMVAQSPSPAVELAAQGAFQRENFALARAVAGGREQGDFLGQPGIARD